MITVRVYHDYYGCETGCCGHVIALSNGEEVFDFTHPYGDTEEFKVKIREIIAKRWPGCVDSIDWESVDISEAGDY